MSHPKNSNVSFKLSEFLLIAIIKSGLRSKADSLAFVPTGKGAVLKSTLEFVKAGISEVHLIDNTLFPFNHCGLTPTLPLKS